jgi:uncharacterized membrane protein YphA (DoxX/SURF4 family)
VKMVSGCMLLLAAEQAYAHALLIPFPNHDLAGQTLLPASLILVVLGGLLLLWGLLTETWTFPAQNGLAVRDEVR